jgi:phosphate transport system substrate-binding protein
MRYTPIFQWAASAMLAAAMLFIPHAHSAEQATTRMIGVHDYPRVDGSTSTQPLGALAACRLTGTSFAWGSHPFDGTRRLYPTTTPYDPGSKLSLAFPDARAYMPTNIHPMLSSRIKHNGTHESYTNLIMGTADLIIAAREPSDDERALARQRGVKVTFAPVALDAFVFLVSSKNPVRNLTLEQVRGIYTGTVTNWAQVGGPNNPIIPYQRNRNSGSQEMMEKLVMKGLKMVKASDLESSISMIGPFNALIRETKGIGYTVMHYDTYITHSPQIAMIAIDGVYPNQENIRNRSYSFVSGVCIAWLDDLPSNSPVRTIRDWFLTNDGQSVVAESGYVPIR